MWLVVVTVKCTRLHPETSVLQRGDLHTHTKKVQIAFFRIKAHH